MGETLTVSWRFQDGISPLTVEPMTLRLVGFFAGVSGSDTQELNPESESSGEFVVNCRTAGRNNPEVRFRATDTDDHARPYISCNNCEP